MILKDSDTVKFFKEFDFYDFEPISSMNDSTEKTPYVELRYKNEKISKIIMHAKHYSYHYNISLMNNQIVRTSSYTPDPYYGYNVDFISDGRMLSYCFSCNDQTEFENDFRLKDTNCWLYSLQKKSKYYIRKYYFEEDSNVIKMNMAFHIDTSHESLLNRPQLFSYNVDSIYSSGEKIFILTTDYRRTNGHFDRPRQFIIDFLMDSIYSINWMRYN